MATQQQASPERRLSLLIELDDRPGALDAALRPFARHGINLTHIESRPRGGGVFDFYVDCEGERGETDIEATIGELSLAAHHVMVLDSREVPWFPRHIAELDHIANNTLQAGGALDAGGVLEADHPGFSDPDYRRRRARIDSEARAYRHGEAMPAIDYTTLETATWGRVWQRLSALRGEHACAQYLAAFAALESECGLGAAAIPQGRDISDFLEARTGFILRPVAGLLRPRDFLNALAFRVFFSTQYVRHHSVPFYTPEPDVCHELLGHAPMFADHAFADLSQEIGLASLGASDEDITRLARCYWYSVEFGLLREGGRLKAYGAGVLSSAGELERACGGGLPAEAFEPWEPDAAARKPYPVTDFQPCYLVAASLHDARSRMREFCETLPRPFYARYNAAAERIWVDRAVRRTEPE